MAASDSLLVRDFIKGRDGLLVPQSAKKPWPRVIIGIPIERTINQHAFIGFLRIFQYGHPFIKVNYTRCDVACNKFAVQLLETDFTHLLILGSDHIHPPDIVQRLSRWVNEDPTRWVVGGLNYRRGPPYDPLAFIRSGDSLYPIAKWEGELLKVDVLGTGSCLINRQVFETIPGPPWFYYEYDRVGEGAWTGEDIVFCRLCQEHSIDIWCDTTTVSPHLITNQINGETFERYLAENPMEIREV